MKSPEMKRLQTEPLQVNLQEAEKIFAGKFVVCCQCFFYKQTSDTGKIGWRN